MNSSSKPLVSGIIIFLNAETFIQEAIESVFAQTYDNWELLLVDDGSTDSSTKIALQYAEQHSEKVHYLEHTDHQNLGMSASRNLGVSHARGEYVAFLDADDVWLPHKLEQQVAILNAQPTAAMLYGRTRFWYSWTGNPKQLSLDYAPDLGVELDTLIEPPTLVSVFLQDESTVPCTCSILVRRDMIEEVGGFEDDFRDMYEDMVFYAKVFVKAPVFVASGCWDWYRQHQNKSCSVAIQQGQYHPVNPSPTRKSFLEWLEQYLVEQKVTDAAIWKALQRELQPYLYPTAPVEIVSVDPAEGKPEVLWGTHLDDPQQRTQIDSYTFQVEGWALGRHSPAVAVEVAHEGTVVRRAPIDVHRPDIGEAFPHVPGAAQSGFRTRVSVTGMGELELGVRAVLRDQSRVTLGTIRVRRRWREGDYDVGAALVSVVIPCHDQAHFLGEAIESVLAQTYPHFEVVVVDDGSTDNTEEVASRYPGVRCVRQENRGLASARNTGIRRSNGGHLVFLDADDRLLPGALEAGLRCFKDHPESAFVAGRYRYIAFDGSALPTPQPPRPAGDRYAALLRDNFINMHAVVMYQRAVFEYVGVFDTSLDACEDYELYLRIARNFPIECHDEVIAEYRKKDGSIARNSTFMLESTLTVLYAQRKYIRVSGQRRDAYNASVKFWQQYYGASLLEEVRAHKQKREWRQATRGLLSLLRHHPCGYASALRAYASRTKRLSR